jgi:hypothetical protein
MQILSLVWGILAILGLGIAFIPCLGSLNWLNIPFAVIGAIISVSARSKPGSQPAATVGLVLNIVAIALGVLRLMLGGGIL